MKKLVLGTRLLAEPIKLKEDTKSKIIVPETIKDDEPSSTFRVVAIGDEVKKIQVGDIVHILPRGGKVFKVDDKAVLDEGQIVMVKRDDD